MAVTNLTARQTGHTSWRLSWTGSAALYYIYQDGVLLGTTPLTWYDIELEPGEYVQIEVVDSAETEPETGYSSRVRLQFDQAPDTALYKIEQYVGTDWQHVAQLNDTGLSCYNYMTGALPDGDYQFRVVPVGKNNSQGTPLVYNIRVVRRPPTPAVLYLYDDGDLIAYATEIQDIEAGGGAT